MATDKETMVAILARQPDDSSYDALLRKLAYARMIQRGLEDSANGRTVSNEDVRKEVDSWRR